MEIYKIKRKMRKNKYLYNTVKFLYKPVNFFMELPVIFREYKKAKKQIKKINFNEPKILFVGIPLHPNLGDQAQYFCIKRWIKENYKGYQIIEYPDCLVNSNILKINSNIKKIMSLRSDFIIFQSGYRTTDVANIKGEYAHRKIIKMFKDKKILVFPQTINFKNDKELKKSVQAYSNNKKILFLARDNQSYKIAKDNYINKIELFPDIVTSLIGYHETNEDRKGILCCMRRDAEKLYDDNDLEEMIKVLKKIDFVERTDTTLDNIKFKDLKQNLEKIIKAEIERFSKYKVVITDRYHGTIFSLISNTPTIVISSTDHKLSSGVNWFKDREAFKEYIYYAKSLNEAIEITKLIYNKKFDYSRKLPNELDMQYYKKLKQKFEDSFNENM